MTDNEKLKLIQDIIKIAYDYAPSEGQGMYFDATLQEIHCVTYFGEEDANDK